MLVLLSDHGARYSDYRDTLQGKLEERLPLLAIVMPSWFRVEDRFHSMWENLVENSVNSLTTPFDLQQRFIHLLKYNKNDLSNYMSFSERGKYGEATSLFRKIDRYRTCADVRVPVHFCPCLGWIRVNLNQTTSEFSSLIKSAGEFIVEVINNQTKFVRSECSQLNLQNILSAFIHIPERHFINFRRTNKGDAFFDDEKSRGSQLKSQLRELSFQIWIETMPGRGKFEAQINYLFEKREFQTDWKLFSRTNKYGNQPACVAKRFPHLRPFCHCS